jgi:hypothetical protein
MSSFSFTSLYIQFWIGDFTVGLCATSRVTVRCTWSHLRLNFSLTLYISAGLHAGQVCGTACRTLFFFSFCLQHWRTIALIPQRIV